MNIPEITNQLTDRLGLKETARKDALAGVPAQSAADLTAAELEAVESAKQAAQDAVRTLDAHHQKAKESVQSCEQICHDKPLAIRKRQQEDTAKLAALDGRQEDLQELERARNGASAAYNKFKAENELQREPFDDDRFTQIIWVIVVVIVEGLFNSYFFATASAYGLAGGVFAALFFSLANVGCAFIGGVMGLRYANHRDPAKKLFGILWASACLCGCVLVVCLSALYRGHLDDLSQTSAIETLQLEAWEASLISLRNLDVWDLIASLNAFLLMFVGAICAFLGFWKGYEFDDPYPGFGKMLRQKEAAKEKHQEAKEELENRAIQIEADGKMATETAMQNMNSASNAMQAVFDGFRRGLGEEAGLSAQVAQLAKSLLSVYRQTNKEIRADSPPAYFDQFPGEAEFKEFDDEHRRLHGERDALAPQVESAAEKCRAAINQIRQGQ